MQILGKHNLPCVRDTTSMLVCDSCQKAKSHQLPYPISSSVSTVPLQLVFSDVWGPAPTSVGRHNYYISFIDDYSKFTWIYLLKHKSDALAAFITFQKLVERKFNRKILTVQSDGGGGNTSNSTLFSKHREFPISCPVPMLTSKIAPLNENTTTLLKLVYPFSLKLACP
jgi:hypothetical protein